MYVFREEGEAGDGKCYELYLVKSSRSTFSV